MIPVPQDAQLDDEQIILLGTSERHLRQARAKRRKRLYVIGVVALGVATTSLAAVNLTVARRGADPVVASPAAPVVASKPVVVPAPPAVVASKPAVVASKPAVEPVTPPPVAAKPVAPVVVEKPVAVTPPVVAKPAPAPVVVAKPVKQPPVVAAKPPVAPAKQPIVASVVPAAKPPVVTVPARTLVAKEPAAKTPEPVAASPAPRQPTAGRVVETTVIEKSTEAAHFGQTGPARDRTMEPQASDSGTRVARWMISTYGKADAERRAELAVTMYPAGDDRTQHWQKVLGHLRATN